MDSLTLRIRTTGTLGWTADRTDAGNWITSCDPLAICVEGSSLDKIHSLIEETLHAQFLDLIEDNQLDDFLLERG